MDQLTLEKNMVPVHRDVILLARDVMNYQKDYFRIKGKAMKTKNPELFKEAADKLKDCKTLEAAWEEKLNEVLNHKAFTENE